MVSLFIANTDNEWYDFLSSRTDLEEVNFWRPSAAPFRAIGAGELFVFRLKSPRNKIGGFGVLSDSTILPLQIAWEAFGISNGAESYDALRTAIARLRPNEMIGPTTDIGCRILVEPVFFPPHAWLDLPPSWANSIQSGKRFSTEEADGLSVWNQIREAASQAEAFLAPGFSESGSRYGPPTLVTPRLGQGSFRIAVTEAYSRQCAVSGGRVLPALDAAHIRPYGEGGTHSKANGILLRKDIHSIFDVGYATIDPSFRFVVSDKIHEVFHNGSEYRRLHGSAIRLPERLKDQPDPQFVRWHNENRFLG